MVSLILSRRLRHQGNPCALLTLSLIGGMSRVGVVLAGPRSKSNQFSCVCLHGDRKPQERKANLELFKVSWLVKHLSLMLSVLIRRPILQPDVEGNLRH